MVEGHALGGRAIRNNSVATLGEPIELCSNPAADQVRMRFVFHVEEICVDPISTLGR